MDFELLRRKLSDTAPIMETVKALGIFGKEAEEFISSCNFSPRTDGVLAVASSNIMEDFFNLYDPSKLKVGMVSFFTHPSITDSKCIIGKVEADPLIVDKLTGKVYVEDLQSPGRTLCDCADSLEHFLWALVPTAQYLARCLVDDSVPENKELTNQYVEECVSIAGGRPPILAFTFRCWEEEENRSGASTVGD